MMRLLTFFANGKLRELPEIEIQYVVKKYLRKLVSGNHLSELAHHLMCGYWDVDEWEYDVCAINTTGVQNICDEPSFDTCEAADEDGKAIIIDYPIIYEWYEPFKKELIKVFKKYGWTVSKTWDDPYDETPGEALFFFKVDRK